jgi:hypothetical protein
MNKMFLFDFFANIWFLIRISWIFFSEFFTYFIQRDYKGFIMNIAKELSAENILYVKVFQAISMEHNLIDETIQQELIQYTDSAPCNAVDIDWETIVRLKTEFGIVLKSTIPVNAGMISIVYESDDDLKIVKIKRTNIDEKLKSAIDRILFLLKLFSWGDRVSQHAASRWTRTSFMNNPR